MRQTSKVNAEVIIRLIPECLSIAEVIKKAGGSIHGSPHYRKVHRVIKEYNINTSHFRGQAWNGGKSYPEKIRHNLEGWLKEDTHIGSHSLKIKLFKAKVLQPQCSSCLITEWQCKPAPLELDHINGVGTDNRLENLRILCCNCHAQTSTYGSKNKKRASD